MKEQKYPLVPLAESIKKEGNFLEKKIQNDFSIIAEEEIQKQFDEKLADWQSTTQYQILRENPYLPLESPLLESEKLLGKRPPDTKYLKTYLDQIRTLSKKSGVSFQFDYYEQEINKLKAKEEKILQKKTNQKTIESLKKENQKESSVLEKMLVREWRKLFDQICSEWELQKLKELREKFFAEIEKWLQLLTELKKTCDALSMETGFLWDLSKGQLSRTNIDLLKKWVRYIQGNEGIKKLCDLMGRIKRHEKSKRQEIIQKTILIKHPITDENSKEEIVGLTFGRDLENVLPSELALLADEDTATLFDLKFVENRLMCFKMEGLRQVDEEIEKLEQITVEEEKPGGPIIICVDTSGSMRGTPENIAKALTLVLTSQAFSQKRDCLLINFSTDIETFTMTDDMGMQQLFNFLQKSFHGGTDVAPAFKHALTMMQKEKFEKADLLVISDFVMHGLEKKITDDIQKMKEKKNRFFSLTIGNLFLNEKLRDLFNGEWVYNPSSMNLDVIKSVKDDMLKI